MTSILENDKDLSSYTGREAADNLTTHFDEIDTLLPGYCQGARKIRQSECEDPQHGDLSAGG